MKLATAQTNLIAWSGTLLRFLSGPAITLLFPRENGPGGNGNFKRRLHRLAHIPSFGPAGVYCIYYRTTQMLVFGPSRKIASWAFVFGAMARITVSSLPEEVGEYSNSVVVGGTALTGGTARLRARLPQTVLYAVTSGPVLPADRFADKTLAPQMNHKL